MPDDDRDDDVHLFDQSNGLGAKFAPKSEAEPDDDRTDEERRRGPSPFPTGGSPAGQVSF